MNRVPRRTPSRSFTGAISLFLVFFTAIYYLRSSVRKMAEDKPAQE